MDFYEHIYKFKIPSLGQLFFMTASKGFIVCALVFVRLSDASYVVKEKLKPLINKRHI